MMGWQWHHLDDMVDVDGSSHLSADSQPKSVGLVWGLAASRRSVCIIIIIIVTRNVGQCPT